MKKLIGIFLILFSTFCLFVAMATPFSQAYFNNWAKENGIVGATLAINNKAYFYGFSNKHSANPVTSRTQFGIGSITKTFISVILLKLEAEGKLNIHDSITQYLPQYRKLKNISIQELMQMTAGFNDTASESDSVSQQIEKAYRKYDPKTAGNWLYSNVSYQLLGILIQKITHKSLAQVLFEKITSPLHLTSIHFPDKEEELSLKEYQDGQVKTSNFSHAYAAGGLVSNIGDLESFIRHLFINKDLLPVKQYKEFISFVKTSENYYAFTGTKAPQFGLGVFKWNIPPYGELLNYTGVLSEGFTSAYTVIGNDIIISQSNTYNHNDFRLLWPYRSFTKSLVKNIS